MTLPHNPILLSQEDWTPSEKYFLIPTLIIPCGSTERFTALKRALALRLGQYFADGLFTWSQVLELSAPIPKDQIAQQLDSFRNQALWENLLRKGYVEKLPSPAHPLNIRVVVLCDFLSGTIENEVATEWLSKLAASVKQKSGEPSTYSLSLVILGEPLENVESLQSYFPRLYLNTTVLGGTQMDASRILQVCQNLIVALTTSEIVRFIKTVMSSKDSHDSLKKINWISLGASTIITDVEAMRLRFVPEVASQFTQRLVPDPLNEAQKKLLDEAVEHKRREFQHGLLFQESPKEKDPESPWSVKKNAQDFGWDITFSDKNKEPQVLKNKDKREGCYLSFESNLAKAIFGVDTGWWLDERNSELLILKTDSFIESLWKRVKFGWNRFVDLLRSVSLPITLGNGASLGENYKGLVSNLRTNLAKNASIQHEKLLDTLSFLIERRSYTGDTPLDINTQWPTGIQAAQYWAERITDRFSHSPIFLYGTEQVAPAQSDGKEFFMLCASADIAAMEETINQYRRFHRSLLSPWGMLLKLIVAYPLITGLLDLFVNWELAATALVSFAGIVLLGVADFVYWGLKDREMLISVRSSINEILAKRVLSLIARVIQDYRLKSAAYFPHIQTLLSELSVLFREEDQRITEQRGQGTIASDLVDEGSIYRLADYARALGTHSVLVDDNYEWDLLRGETAFVLDDPETSKTILSWKSEAKRSANAEAAQGSNGKIEKAENFFIDKYVRSLLEERKLATTVLEDLKIFSNRYALREFATGQLASYTLTEKCDDLRNGLKWRWLYQRSIPLGGEKKNSTAFTLISVPDQAPLTSQAGRASEYWIQEAQIITSRQSNEISCMRGTIEWEKL